MKVRKLILLMMVIVIQSCSSSSQQSKQHIVKVTSQPLVDTLFYTGTIQPLKTTVVSTPVDGVITGTFFQYGDEVKTGQLVFNISSTKFLADYKSALMQYVKSKSDFDNARAQLTEADFLHQNELISDDDYKTRQANFYSNRLAFIQAKDALSVLMRQLEIKNIDLNKLSIADIDKITQAMQFKFDTEQLHIFSPVDGVILSGNKNESETKKLMQGDTIKQSDSLALIGDMRGLTVRIKVNEMTVNQLKSGQAVRVTGIAFPSEVLLGEIKQIDRQGDLSSGGLPTFSVEIVVPKLTNKQRELIHVGMSAKVEIDIQQSQRMMIPLAAIQERKGQYYVRTMDVKTKAIREAMVNTGETTLNSVEILSGLRPGDNLVIAD